MLIVDLTVPLLYLPIVQGDFIAMRYWSACMQLHVVAMLASGLLGATEGNTFAATGAYEGILGAITGASDPTCQRLSSASCSIDCLMRLDTASVHLPMAPLFCVSSGLMLGDSMPGVPEVTETPVPTGEPGRRRLMQVLNSGDTWAVNMTRCRTLGAH